MRVRYQVSGIAVQFVGLPYEPCALAAMMSIFHAVLCLGGGCIIFWGGVFSLLLSRARVRWRSSMVMGDPLSWAALRGLVAGDQDLDIYI